MDYSDKMWIDENSYYNLLKRWRFSDNDPIFQGASGNYYAETMQKRKAELSENECVRISKLIGWEK